MAGSPLGRHGTTIDVASEVGTQTLSRRSFVGFGGFARSLLCARRVEVVTILAVVVRDWCCTTERALCPCTRPSLVLAAVGDIGSTGPLNGN